MRESRKNKDKEVLKKVRKGTKCEGEKYRKNKRNIEGKEGGMKRKIEELKM